MGGGGGTTTTNPNIPPEFMPYLTPLIRSSTGYMGGLQDYFWGDSGEGQGYTPPSTDGMWGYNDGPSFANQDVYPTPPPGYISYPDDYVSHVGGDSVDGGQAPPPAPAPNPAPPPGAYPPVPPGPTPNPTPVPVPPPTPIPNPSPDPPPPPPPPPPSEPPEYTTPSGESPWSVATPMSVPSTSGIEEAASVSSAMPASVPMENAPMVTAAESVANPDDPGAGGVPPWWWFQEESFTDPAGQLSGIGIQNENTRSIAGPSIGLKRAQQMAMEMAEPTQGESAAWGGLGDLYSMENQMATGYGMENDPAMQATYDTFEKFAAPMIADQYSEMGLGRSADKNEAMSLGLADMLMPSMQGYLDRQTGTIDRNTNIYGNAIQSGLNLAGTELGRQNQSYSSFRDIGDVQRGIAQETMDAPWEDFMRRSSLGENALNSAFGGIVPSTIGSTVTSSGGK